MHNFEVFKLSLIKKQYTLEKKQYAEMDYSVFLYHLS